VTTQTFADLGVPAPLIRELTAQGITAPFPIQIDTLPDTLAGCDVLGRGKTGSTCLLNSVGGPTRIGQAATCSPLRIGARTDP